MTTLTLPQRPSRVFQGIPWKETVAALLILAVAWIYGLIASHSPVLPLVPNVLPGAVTVKTVGQTFLGYDGAGKLVGYAAAADATGYGGPIYLLVGVDTSGKIQGIQIIEQRETPGFYALLQDRRFVQQFLGKTTSDSLMLGQDVDSVTGASLSAGGVALAIQRAVREIDTGKSVLSPQAIQFGLPEITLLGLFIVAVTQMRMRNAKRRKLLRWGALLISLVVLGFMLNQPLTVGNIASLLVGYWPLWQNHLYWYLLIAIGLGYTVLSGKNVYCYRICPFGAVQECFGALGNAKPYLPAESYPWLKWVPRWLAVLALALGFAFRQPGTISYEPFGTLFSFSAGFFPWMLLVFVLFGSIMILRPFCYYLCPVGAVMNFLMFANRQVKRLWKNVRTARKGTTPA